MPHNPLDNSFARAFRFADERDEGDEITRADLDLVLDDIEAGINTALDQALDYVGEWSAATGVFPATRPDGSPVRKRDAWRVTTAGTTGGIDFAVNELLVALRSSPAQVYPNNWLRLPNVTSVGAAQMLAEILDEASDIAGQIIPLVPAITALDAALTRGWRSLSATATDGQTVFPVADGYSADLALVFLNGALLGAADYTAEDGQTVTLATAAEEGDHLVVLSALPPADGGLDGLIDDPDWNTPSTTAAPTVSAVKLRIEAQIAALTLPTGLVGSFAATTPPVGWIKADGQTLTRSGFPALWAHAQASGNLASLEATKLPGQWGPGDGATTFTVPDLRGTFERAWDDGKGLDASRLLGSLQADQNKAHGHGVNLTTGGAGGHTHTGTTGAAGAHSHTFSTVNFAAFGGIMDTLRGNERSGPGTSTTSIAPDHTHTISINSVGDHTHSVSGTTASEGGAEARPVNIALLRCIKL